MSQIIPILPANYLAINNMQMAWVSNTTFTVTAGLAKDSTDSIDINLGNFLSLTSPLLSANVTTTVNAAVNGLNGLDTGTFAEASMYYVYVIGDQAGFNQPGVIISLSSTGPLMPKGEFPSGYSVYRRIGYVFTATASAHILNFYQNGTGPSRKFYYDSTFTVLSAGTNTTSYTGINLSAVVPPVINTVVTLQAVYTPNTAGNSFYIRPTGSSVTNTTVTGSGVVAGKGQSLQLQTVVGVFSGAAYIDYTEQASDVLALSVLAFEDYL